MRYSKYTNILFTNYKYSVLEANVLTGKHIEPLKNTFILKSRSSETHGANKRIGFVTKIKIF